MSSAFRLDLSPPTLLRVAWPSLLTYAGSGGRRGLGKHCPRDVTAWPTRRSSSSCMPKVSWRHVVTTRPWRTGSLQPSHKPHIHGCTASQRHRCPPRRSSAASLSHTSWFQGPRQSCASSVGLKRLCPIATPISSFARRTPLSFSLRPRGAVHGTRLPSPSTPEITLSLWPPLARSPCYARPPSTTSSSPRLLSTVALVSVCSLSM